MLRSKATSPHVLQAVEVDFSAVLAVREKYKADWLARHGVALTFLPAPIINQPQVAILSLDGVHKRATVIESEAGDSIAIRPIGVLAQSFDHRAVDGAYSAAYLRTLKGVIEARGWEAIVNS
jgi:pyruvate/2-oxoglutarate dehydrogenase complex dihydrolipoamide acyltransferase (E2) component